MVFVYPDFFFDLWVVIAHYRRKEINMQNTAGPLMGCLPTSAQCLSAEADLETAFKIQVRICKFQNIWMKTPCWEFFKFTLLRHFYPVSHLSCVLKSICMTGRCHIAMECRFPPPPMRFLLLLLFNNFVQWLVESSVLSPPPPGAGYLHSNPRIMSTPHAGASIQTLLKLQFPISL